MNRSMCIIHKCLQYIEAHVNEKITLEFLALEVGISKFHLHRMFKNLTGITLSDYIRMRKLSKSIEDLFSTNYRIVDIAIEYGFEYEQNYIRAFKRQYNTTPYKARKEKRELRITEPFQISEFTEIDGALCYKPFYVFKPEMFLVGVKHKMKDRDEESLATEYGREFFYHKRQAIKNVVNSNHYYGYTFWEAKETGYNYYIPSMRVDQLNEIPEDMVSITVPQNKYAVFKLVGFFDPEVLKGSDLDSMLSYMYGKWINGMGYQLVGDYRIEFIDKSISNNQYCELFLYLPIA